jgi:hypothetical protein
MDWCAAHRVKTDRICTKDQGGVRNDSAFYCPYHSTTYGDDTYSEYMFDFCYEVIILITVERLLSSSEIFNPKMKIAHFRTGSLPLNQLQVVLLSHQLQGYWILKE